jgi:hypothetical protein
VSFILCFAGMGQEAPAAEASSATLQREDWQGALVVSARDLRYDTWHCTCSESGALHAPRRPLNSQV